MCLIIQSNKDIPLNPSFIENVAKKNNDGFGLMWIQDNKIHAYKYQESNPKAFWDKFNPIKEYNPVIHFRMKTHGKIDHENTHPYYCGFGIWLMHNGIIHQTSGMSQHRSDTWHFIDSILKPLFTQVHNPHEFMRSNVFQYIVEDYIGRNNRIILGDRGGFVIMNPETWVTIENAETKMKGLVVSNSYAWDLHACLPKKKDKKIKVHVHQPQSYGAWNPHTGRFDYTQKPMIKYSDMNLEEIGRGFYIDDENDIWEKESEWRYNRRPDLQFEDAVNILAAEETKEANASLKKDETAVAVVETCPFVPDPPLTTVITPTLPVAVAKDPSGSIIINNPKITIDEELEDDEIEQITDEQYTEALVAEWKKASKESIHTLVYTDPDDAARVMVHLLYNR